MAEASSTKRQERIDHILRSAIPVFAQNGYRRTSMQLLAEASGISRPALYQYFADRSELFLSAFQLLLDENTDAALNALVVNRSLESQLDGYLQRLVGDPYATLSSSKFGDELMEVKGELGGAAVMTAMGRAAQGLHTHLLKIHKVDAETAGRGSRYCHPFCERTQTRSTVGQNVPGAIDVSCSIDGVVMRSRAVRGCRRSAHWFHSWLRDVGIVTGS